jgi:hypothetical protein
MAMLEIEKLWRQVLKKNKRITAPNYYTSVRFPIPYTVSHLQETEIWSQRDNFQFYDFVMDYMKLSLNIPALCHATLVMSRVV